jgi:hypothetical protein
MNSRHEQLLTFIFSLVEAGIWVFSAALQDLTVQPMLPV